MEKVYHFLKYRFIAMSITVGMIIIFATISIMKGGHILGIDFVGGVNITAKFEKGINESKIREALAHFDPTVQQIGKAERNEYIVSTKISSKDMNVKKDLEILKNAISEKFKNVEVLSEDSVGPAIGDYLKKSAVKLFLIANLFMAIYLAFRFETKYAVGAMVALYHDLILTVTFCGVAGVELNIPVIAALLTIFGYSVNDTIIIFDRIRENVQHQSKESIVEVIDKSVTQTLSRTVLTVLTTLFSVLALYFLGGKVLNDFAVVLLFGITTGTFSSIYIASPVVVMWENYQIKRKLKKA